MKYCCLEMMEAIDDLYGMYPPEEDPEIYPDEQYWTIGYPDEGGSLHEREIFYCPFCGKKLNKE